MRGTVCGTIGKSRTISGSATGTATHVDDALDNVLGGLGIFIFRVDGSLYLQHNAARSVLRKVSFVIDKPVTNGLLDCRH